MNVFLSLFREAFQLTANVQGLIKHCGYLRKPGNGTQRLERRGTHAAVREARKEFCVEDWRRAILPLKWSYGVQSQLLYGSQSKYQESGHEWNGK